MRKRPYVPVIATLAGLALVGLLIYGVAVQAPARTLDEAVARNLRPPAPKATMRLPLLSGAGSRSLASYRGEVVILNIWASWCPPCRAEAPLLQKAQRSLLRHVGTVLGVTARDASPDSLSFVHSYHLTYPNLRDSTGEFAGAYGTDQLPETFVLDRRGHVVAISRGEVDEVFLRHAVSLAESS